MNTVFSRYKILFFAYVLVLGPSCKKFVTIDAPDTAITATELFKTEQGAVAAVSGLYSQMSQSNLSFANGGLTVYPALSADELVNNNPNPDYDQFKNDAVASDNFSISSKFWTAPYKTIYQANAILEALSSSSIGTTTKNQLRGEVLFVRAFHYFYLINCFGDVPYITTTDYNENAKLARTPAATILSSIVKDLTEAQQLLSDDYATSTKGRPNKWTAIALLGRVYLYQQDWANAEAQATAIINSGKYSLASLNSVFQPSSAEAIWLMQRDNNNTAEGIAFVPSSSTAKPTFRITDNLLNAFEANDNRKTSWLRKNTVNGQDYYYPYKYKLRSGTPPGEYLLVFRLAEMYLIRAEARAHQNKITDALTDLNTIRNRAGLVDAMAATPADLLTAIEHERQVELFAEWGHRWFDLKRTGRADAVFAPLKGSNWQTTDQIYPIPLDQILANPALTQNAGY